MSVCLHKLNIDPLPDVPILGCSIIQHQKHQIKICCQENWQIGKQLFYWVENTVGKEEIARYKQLLFPQYLQKLSFVDASNKYLWSEGLKLNVKI